MLSKPAQVNSGNSNEQILIFFFFFLCLSLTRLPVVSCQRSYAYSGSRAFGERVFEAPDSSQKSDRAANFRRQSLTVKPK